MECKVGDVVMPGYIIQEADDLVKESKKVVLGNGLRLENDSAVSSKSGLLCKRKNIFYVDSYQKKYIPAKNDNVIGIIQSKTPEFFWVDISYSELAILPYLAFEGATKKNRPEINVGDLVYAKVVLANPDLEAELVCVDSTGKKGKLGELKDGLMFPCSINLIRKILNDKCNLLHLLSKECPYELVAGINGRIWINTKSLRTTILLRDTILEAEHTAYNKMKDLVDKFAGELTGIKS
ncbi:exosome complex component RRP40 [Chironomus tepperi]|uniref:exosome complex component RRP40 n=1 Tax=Chironomus tepperi TaxID=113505 RepID=UPI00391F438F